MSSGTVVDFSVFQKIFGKIAGGGAVHDQPAVLSEIRLKGLSPRQQRLNAAWAVYRCEGYSSCRVDWDGGQAISQIESEAVRSGAFIPPGFYDAGALLPLRYRRPSAPYALGRVIVDRFTSLLFSDQRHPRVHVEDDEQTDDFVGALIEGSRFWAAWMQARMMGGAQGTACVGFQFVNGKPVLEVHDPRWCIPTFRDRHTWELSRLEILYQYPREVLDHESGLVREVPFWYRRLIDAQRDVVFRSIPVEQGLPVWEVESEVQHGLGECPAVWVQNTPVLDDIDGDPDCHGAFEMIHAIDMLLAQAQTGTIANADPTLVISTNADLPPDLAKGSRAPIKLPSDGRAEYLELEGVGAKSASELADLYRRRVLEVTSCVLEDGTGTAARTATEIERAHAAMFARADMLREQYTERGIKPLLHKMLRAARLVSEARPTEDGGVVRGEVLLAPKLIRDAAGRVIEKRRREPGTGEILRVAWPRYTEPTLEEAKLAVETAVMALSGKIVDDTAAVALVAPYFAEEDSKGLLDRVRGAETARTLALDSAASGLAPGESLGGTEPLPPVVAPSAPLNGAQITALLDIVQQTARGELDPEVAVRTITLSFPGIGEDEARALVAKPGTDE
jgi:hypothetical protein